MQVVLVRSVPLSLYLLSDYVRLLVCHGGTHSSACACACACACVMLLLVYSVYCRDELDVQCGRIDAVV